MTTKEMERQALEQIKKIVEGLDNDSYIGMAFEGCFEVAEENIENDWGCSMKQRAESAEKAMLHGHEMVNELKAENKKLKEEVQEANEDAKYWREGASKYHEESVANWNKFREQEDRAEALEQEIIKLKAKLYDLIVK